MPNWTGPLALAAFAGAAIVIASLVRRLRFILLFTVFIVGIVSAITVLFGM